MDLINKVGQRKFTIYLALFAVLASVCIYFFKFQTVNFMHNIIPIIIGVILFSLPNILLSFIAHKSRDYRLNALNFSFLLILANTSIFIFSLYNVVFTNILFLLCIVELFFVLIFFVITIKYESKKRKNKEKQNKLRKRL